MSNPVIIVGAPRSGTNILRDVLTSVPGFATWPCDEINLLWKHHNRDVPHDELTPAHARPEVHEYLHRQFASIGRRNDAEWVVEKTCATSLRVDFVATVIPEAKYVFIRRDGLDAAASAMQRWDARLDVPYLARKLRFAPVSDLPFYAGQFVSKRLASVRARSEGSVSRRVTSWWGPKPHDFRTLQREHPLDELALIQWKRCVDLAREQLAHLPSAQVHEVVYEDFARSPDEALAALLEFVGADTVVPPSATRAVSSASIGKGRATFDAVTTMRLTELGADTLAHFGYA